MKILIVTKNWLGDILFEEPAIEMIRARYPDAEILCMTHPRCREMLEHHPALDRLLEFDERSTHRSLVSRFRFIKTLRKEKIDAVYFFHGSRTRAFLLRLAGIPKRIGYAAKHFHFLTHPVNEPKNPMHHVDYFIHLLTQSGFPRLENARYRFYLAAKDRLSVERLLEGARAYDFVCFHLGANWEPKRWPAVHFAKLADLIHAKWQLPILLTGGPDDKPLGDEVMRESRHAKIYSMIGKTTLGELGALFEKALFVVSGDSGPMHVAAGVGVRVLAIFGPTNPDLTGPRGVGENIVLKFVPQGYASPWYGTDFPAQGWLSHISPEEVFAALETKNWGDRSRHCERPEGAKQSSFKNQIVSSGPSVGRPLNDSKNILLITLSNIGDVILTTPVLMSLAARFPRHRMTVVAGPRAKGILEGSRFVDRLVIYDKAASLKDKIRFLKELRKVSYEVVVDLKNSAIPFLVSCRKRSPIFRVFKKSIARERHLEVLERMGLGVQNIPPFDFCNEREEAVVFSILKQHQIPVEQDWIAVAPMAASELKTWPLEYFQQVIAGLVRETPYSVFLLGGEREAKLMALLAEAAPHRVFNLGGLTSLRESAALIRQSRLLLANDSSAGHFGFEMNHPSVVLFGPTDPKKVARAGEFFRVLQESAPCVPCEKSFCRMERRLCLLDLMPQRVLKSCLELLEAAKFKNFLEREGKVEHS